MLKCPLSIKSLDNRLLSALSHVLIHYYCLFLFRKETACEPPIGLQLFWLVWFWIDCSSFKQDPKSYYFDFSTDDPRYHWTTTSDWFQSETMWARWVICQRYWSHDHVQMSMSRWGNIYFGIALFRSQVISFFIMNVYKLDQEFISHACYPLLVLNVHPPPDGIFHVRFIVQKIYK